MPIGPFLAGQAFEPDPIQEMWAALEIVCGKLALTLTDDPATRLVNLRVTGCICRSCCYQESSGCLRGVDLAIVAPRPGREISKHGQ